MRKGIFIRTWCADCGKLLNDVQTKETYEQKYL